MLPFGANKLPSRLLAVRATFGGAGRVADDFSRPLRLLQIVDFGSWHHRLRHDNAMTSKRRIACLINVSGCV
jgi:hypothetical protein